MATYTHDAFGNHVHKGDTVITIAPDPNFPYATFIPAKILKCRQGEALLLPHAIVDNEPAWTRSDAFILKCHHIQLPQPSALRNCIPCHSQTTHLQCHRCHTYYCQHHKHRCKGKE